MLLNIVQTIFGIKSVVGLQPAIYRVELLNPGRCPGLDCFRLSACKLMF